MSMSCCQLIHIPSVNIRFLQCQSFCVCLFGHTNGDRSAFYALLTNHNRVKAAILVSEAKTSEEIKLALNSYHTSHICKHWPRAYFNVQLMTISAVVKWNCAVVVVNFEEEQWKSVEK